MNRRAYKTWKLTKNFLNIAANHSDRLFLNVDLYLNNVSVVDKKSNTTVFSQSISEESQTLWFDLDGNEYRLDEYDERRILIDHYSADKPYNEEIDWDMFINAFRVFENKYFNELL